MLQVRVCLEANSWLAQCQYAQSCLHHILGLVACRDIVPLNRTKSNFNYNLDEKRVLNFENIVNDDDNIKQDISIDVYGRAEKEESAEDEAAAPAEKQVRHCFSRILPQPHTEMVKTCHHWWLLIQDIGKYLI